MNPNERFSPQGAPGRPEGRAAQDEQTLKTDKIQIERKTFHFALKENPRGRFLRITEEVNGRRDTVIVPATGLGEFKRVLDEIVRVSQEAAPAQQP
jgi:hypothetical protein